MFFHGINSYFWGFSEVFPELSHQTQFVFNALQLWASPSSQRVMLAWVEHFSPGWTHLNWHAMNLDARSNINFSAPRLEQIRTFLCPRCLWISQSRVLGLKNVAGNKGSIDLAARYKYASRSSPPWTRCLIQQHWELVSSRDLFYILTRKC